MRVMELVRRKGSAVITVDPVRPVAAALESMMRHGVGAAVVVDGRGTLVGVISERDVIEALQRRSDDVRQLPVSQVMHRAPTCEPDDPLREVMTRMTSERMRHIVVVDSGRPIGVVSVGDMVKHRLEELELETGVLRDYVAAQRAT